jgi:hypothetical protein
LPLQEIRAQQIKPDANSTGKRDRQEANSMIPAQSHRRDRLEGRFHHE